MTSATLTLTSKSVSLSSSSASAVFIDCNRKKNKYQQAENGLRKDGMSSGNKRRNVGRRIKFFADHFSKVKPKVIIQTISNYLSKQTGHDCWRIPQVFSKDNQYNL